MLHQAIDQKNVGRLSLKEFYDKVQVRLAPLNAGELRAILFSMARQIAPERRQAFLDQLRPSPEEGLTLAALRPDQLLADITRLTRRIEEAMEHPPALDEQDT